MVFPTIAFVKGSMATIRIIKGKDLNKLTIKSKDLYITLLGFNPFSSVTIRIMDGINANNIAKTVDIETIYRVSLRALNNISCNILLYLPNYGF